MPAGLLEDAEVYLEVCEAESNRRKVPVKLEIITNNLEKYHFSRDYPFERCAFGDARSDLLPMDDTQSSFTFPTRHSLALLLIARFVIPLFPGRHLESPPDQVICHSYIHQPATTTYNDLPFPSSSSLCLCKYIRAHTYHLHHTALPQ
jgi:hypothetical protein